MVNYREILRLDSLGYSQHQIAASVHSSRNTIRRILKNASEKGFKWSEDAPSSKELEEFLCPSPDSDPKGMRKEPDFPAMHRELARPGVTLMLLWTEYSTDCAQSGVRPLMYSQYCEKYRRWARLAKATMRIHHKPGDAMQVDWAGTTLPYYDPVTGEAYETYLFAAVLPCSCYAYLEACTDMKETNWLLCHVHAYEYFGGVTRLLIPDNLKTGVVKNTRMEVVLNRSYQELAQHYGTAIVPARVRRPQDKSLAEGTVKLATTWVIAALRNKKFFSFAEVRAAVAEKLEELNERSFAKKEGNRRSSFLAEESSFLQELPPSPYEPAVWSTAKVPLDYTVSDGRNRYSVPFDLIGETVDIRITLATVEIFFRGGRVASHPRAASTLKAPVIHPEHMPMEHRKYLSYNADGFIQWAKSIGEATSRVVGGFLTRGDAPEQGFKACASLNRLSDRYGHDRLEKACAHILMYSSVPTIRNISAVLKNGQDKIPEPQNAPSPETGRGITRGAAYFKRGGEA